MITSTCLRLRLLQQIERDMPLPHKCANVTYIQTELPRHNIALVQHQAVKIDVTFICITQLVFSL